VHGERAVQGAINVDTRDSVPDCGHALYIKDGRLHYAYNFVGSFEQKIVAAEDVPSGTDLVLSASFDKDSEDPPGISTGILSLHHGDHKVGEARIKTQPGKFMIGEEGLCVGRDIGEPVTEDYSGASPPPVHWRDHQAGRGRRERRAVRRSQARGRSRADPRIGEWAPGPHRLLEQCGRTAGADAAPWPFPRRSPPPAGGLIAPCRPGSASGGFLWRPGAA
jgi:hypothetical protein